MYSKSSCPMPEIKRTAVESPGGFAGGSIKAVVKFELWPT